MFATHLSIKHAMDGYYNSGYLKSALYQHITSQDYFLLITHWTLLPKQMMPSYIKCEVTFGAE